MSCVTQWQILIWRLGPAERYSTELCILPLDQTVGSGFVTDVVSFYREACIRGFIQAYAERRV